MIKAIGIWPMHSRSDAVQAGPGAVVFMTPMRGIYQPLSWLLTLFGGS